MNKTANRSSRRIAGRTWAVAGLVSMALVAASCSDDKDTAATVAPVQTTVAPPADTTPGDTTPADTTPADTTPADTTPGAIDPSSGFPDRGPATGEPITVGLVNTEGTPGLDFPDIRIDTQATVDYLNEHGGLGGRPVTLVNCTVKGSPETSQACAQELAGKKVDLIMVGLDLFPDYATYTAANIPVIGVLPILPGDYTANALYLTGGNATTMGAFAALAVDHYKAKTVGIVSADNPGANGTEASLTAALDVAGIAHTTVKGGDNETDAGYQGLMREAAKDNPDLLVSLYSDAGCIGTMRGRAALGITIPVLTTSICSGSEVLSVVGDDATGWSFVGVGTQKDSPELAILQEILAPALGIDPSEVDSTALGLGGLGVIGMMSFAVYANQMADEGLEVTGPALFDYLKVTKGLTLWPNGATIDCGASPKYPTICSFTFPASEYIDGKLITIPGAEAVSALDYLP